MILKDLGADVDKLEDPRGGDYLRFMPPQGDDGVNTVFRTLNRGKRSAVLDLKTDAGRDAFLSIIPSYDVLIESFRPGVMARLGLGYETLRERHPGLVYCALSGYGQDGPDAQRAGHDLNYLARSGVLGMTGPTDSPPQVSGGQMADIGGGLYAVIGILAALRARDANGAGRFVDISMCESAASFGLFGLAAAAGGMHQDRGQGVLAGGIAPYATYTTQDGRHMALASLEPKFWNAFCAEVGMVAKPDALMPGPHQAAYKTKLTEIFAARTYDDWCDVARRVDCCLEPVLLPHELQNDPQHMARELFDGPTRMRTPVAGAANGEPPAHGEHNDTIVP